MHESWTLGSPRMRVRKRTFAIMASMAPMLALLGLILTLDGCERASQHRNAILHLARSNQTLPTLP